MSGLQVLQDLKLAEKKARYPTFPAHALPKPRYTDRTANGLQKCIIDFIRFNNGQAERISVEGRVIDSRKIVTDVIGRRRIIGNVQRIKSSAQVGSADISATIAGRSIKIEVKIGRDTQSPEQKAYQRQVEAAGGIYLIVGYFQEFYLWYCSFVGNRKEVPHA